jgi:carbonic anhydrase
MKTALLLSAMLSFSIGANAASAPTAPHWSYEGSAGPEHWGELSADFKTCHNGKFQSPIDIRNTIEGRLPPLRLEFHTAAEKLVNNGHTVQVDVDDEDNFMLDGEIFRLKQYHFHTPSENQINGHAYPLEAHFVHANADGEIAVIAVMFEVGKENSALNPLIAAMPKQENQAVEVKQRMDLTPLFPTDRHYYRFSGSLTTPPCTEGLRWLVMKQPVTLSQSQLQAFQQALKNANNRPLQPLHGRLIVE